MRQVLFVFILFFVSIGTTAQEMPSVNEEQVVRVGYPAFDWQPFTYVTKEKKMIGLLPSLFQEIANNSGYRTQIVSYPTYIEVLQALRDDEIDIIMGVSMTPERMEWMHFSSPLMLLPYAAITNDTNVSSFIELKGKHIATETGFAINEVLSNSAGSQLKVTGYSGSQEAYSAVVDHAADAYIGNAITLDYLHTHQDTANKLDIKLLNDMPFDQLHFAATMKNSELIDDLNKGLKLIPNETFTKLYETWLTSSQIRYVYQQHDLNLTEPELNALRDQKVLKVLYSADNYPFAFTNDMGEMDGMSVDILKVVAENLNLNIESTAYSGTQLEQHFAENNFDLIPAFTCEKNSLDYVLCTSSYTKDPWVAVTANNLITAQITNTKELGLLNLHQQHIDTAKYFSQAEITTFNSTKHLLNAILAGKVEVGLLPLSKASSVLSIRYLGQLKLTPNPIGEYTRAISFGVNKDSATLASILNKAKAAIHEDELEAIKHKWNDISINSDFSYEKIPSWILLLLGGSVSIFLVIVYSNRKLKNEIAQRHSIEKELRLVNNNFGGIVAQLIRYGDDVDDISWSYVSGNIEKYLGLSPEQLYQTPSLLMEFLAKHADEHDFLEDIEESRFCDSLYTTMKLNIDGKISWFQLTGICTKVDKNRHWTYTLVDISLLKEKQAELDEARLIAESATEAKSRFLAMMSHEIRTPISGILSLLELMTPHLNSSELHGIHKNLTHSGNNLLNIVNDVLDFSKIEAGKLGLSPAVCQLSSFISELVQPHIVHVERKGIKFKLWLDPKLAYSLNLDNLRLKQVLNNLLNNASKFTTEGEIWLSVDLVSATDKEQTISFAVTDSGIGISEEDIAKLFIPFEQVDLSSERRFSGTGLGLSICEQLVKLMGGEISVNSKQGQGSTFRFTLTFPIAAVEVPSTVNKRCGVMMLDESDYDLLCEYLRAWQCTAYNLQHLENKAALAAHVAKAKIQVLLLPQDWCELHALTPSWAKRNLTNVQVIQLRRQSMLSPTPAELGWALSVNPLLPEHLLHLLTKPEFFDVKPSAEQNQPEQAITREQAIASNRLILVAEDHPINQDVIRMQLSKLGYFGDIFDNGQQALTAYKQNRYDLVLTDCHMPELDGYGLVSAIREHEQQEKLNRLGVIALTANAISSEKARCHQYGFDDYLIKPVTLEQLQNVLNNYLVEAQQAPIADHAQQHEPSMQDRTFIAASSSETLKCDLNDLAVIDIKALEANFGDLQLCINLLTKFIATCDSDMQILNQAVAEHDFDATAHSAHKLKGAAGVIECELLVITCAEIETAASTQDIDAIKELLVQLEKLIAQISNQVNKLK
ncbi:transporter substrate-binding domain-containing protein [Shewanella sp. Isolate13]|uniref:transporter substrate-binding domain-containing protein n=1 Tax=Shewanella sp. Isolate13 TaxID=2908531 RepID=UPI001EFC6467|nr:transporter substrate-binding domain-containing protein [Shewanella sp. Isolate13]MCG9729861.1 transporter substrate-binding domain-containing protein [Shewanella sp. Isolate13]